ncbi:hypothetical protein CEXT_143741 [Caerostris extrusa]|uniref:Uncharacterized protein n=1 Tax=Caerostris extrusa TaxID=172846 RepID=A0AAV4QWL3_CAEEX|nr:hypothetical protein CEXT_143741 [Caerostris extrusa]
MSTLGEYDQCINIEALDPGRRNKNKKVMFTGKYCAVDLRPPLPPKALLQAQRSSRRTQRLFGRWKCYKRSS